MSWLRKSLTSRRDNKIRPSLDDGLKLNPMPMSNPEQDDIELKKEMRLKALRMLERKSGGSKTMGRRQIHDDNSEMESEVNAEVIYKCKDSHMISKPSVFVSRSNISRDHSHNPNLKIENSIRGKEEFERSKPHEDIESEVSQLKSQTSPIGGQKNIAFELKPVEKRNQSTNQKSAFKNQTSNNKPCGRRNQVADSDVILQLGKSKISAGFQQYAISDEPPDHPILEISETGIGMNHYRDNNDGTESEVLSRFSSLSKDHRHTKQELPVPDYAGVEVYEFEIEQNHSQDYVQSNDDNDSETFSGLSINTIISSEDQKSTSEVPPNYPIVEIYEFEIEELPNKKLRQHNEDNDSDSLTSKEVKECMSDGPHISECGEESVYETEDGSKQNSELVLNTENNNEKQPEKLKGRRQVSESESENCSSMVTEESLQSEEAEVVRILSVRPDDYRVTEKAVDKDTNLPGKEKRYEKVTSTDRWVKNSVLWNAIVYSDTKLDLGAADSDTEIFDLNLSTITRLLKPTRKYDAIMGSFQASILEPICDADFSEYREETFSKRRKSFSPRRTANSISTNEKKLKKSRLRSKSPAKSTTDECKAKPSRLGFARRSLRWIGQKFGWKKSGDTNSNREIESHEDDDQKPPEKLPSQRRLKVLAFLDHGAGRSPNIRSTERS